MRYETGNVVKISEEFEWKIPNFFSLSTKSTDWYNSPTFSFAGELWYLTYYPNKEENIRLALSRHATGPPTNLKFSVCLKSLNGEKTLEQYLDHTFVKERRSFGMAPYMSRSELIARKSEFLTSDVLIVICTIKCSKPAEDKNDNVTTQCSYCKDQLGPGNISSHEKKCLEKPIKCPECSDVTVLRNWYEHECQKTKPKGETCTSVSADVYQGNKVLHDFKALFLKKEDCDVIIKVQGLEFQAHRLILQARSSVLASAFRNDMKEKASGFLEIKDCDPSSFSDFLCFLYCGDTEVISKANVFSLFMVADKYDVQDLRTLCLKFMKENLSVDTFCDAITIGLRHSETDLVKLTTDFFVKNAPKIIITVKWQLFLEKNPIQSNELLIKLLVNNPNSTS